MGVYDVRVTRKRGDAPERMEDATQCRHPCQNISANPFADQGGSLPPPGPPASLSPFQSCYRPKNPKMRALDMTAVMGVPGNVK